MQKIKSVNLDYEPVKGTNVKVFVNTVNEGQSKNKALRAFANVSIWTEGKKFPRQYNGLQVVEGKTGNVFIVEPQQPSYKVGDEIKNGKVWYQMDQEVKDDVLARILKSNEPKETTTTATKEA